MKKIEKDFIKFWFSQLFSELGSSVTSYALILYIYSQSRQAFDVSVLSFCTFVPYIIGGFVAGPIIDNHSKKKIIFIVDTLSFFCTIGAIFLLHIGQLSIIYVAIINAIIGFANAFQIPSVSIVVERLTSKENYTRVSGMLSFSDSLIVSFSSVIAISLYKIVGIKNVLLFDLCTYFIANIILLLFVNIPRSKGEDEKMEDKSFERFIRESKEGMNYLKTNRALLKLIIVMSLINFFSRITYENILTPMVIARSGSEYILGIVNTIIGAAGIVGGLIVSAKPLKGNLSKWMFGAIAVSFFFGDLFMAFGHSLIPWVIGSIAASLPIPFMAAAQRAILYNTVPEDKQARVFSLRNAIQSSLIPVGLLLGGYLADGIFEPFVVQNKTKLSIWLYSIFGATEGAGMGMMFFITGVVGSVIAVYMLKSKDVLELGKVD